MNVVGELVEHPFDDTWVLAKGASPPFVAATLDSFDKPSFRWGALMAGALPR